MSSTILLGDCLESMSLLATRSVHCCVTSPPYFGLRDYGHAGQIGLEPTPDEYVAKMVDVFREVRRVLRDDGTLWLNLGDSYSSGGRTTQTVQTVQTIRRSQVVDNKRIGPTSRNLDGDAASGKQEYLNGTAMRPPVVDGLGSKQLLGIPWRVALALQADGWYLRSDIIWHKPNPMPESVTDRPTKAHEYLFLLAKSQKYYYDADAVKEPAVNAGARVSLGSKSFSKRQADGAGVAPSGNANAEYYDVPELRNRRSVWTVATKPFKGAHFATFPPNLIEPCILAGSPAGGTVLDPFGGSGTTGLVANQHGRDAILCELNQSYAEMARVRIGTARVV